MVHVLAPRPADPICPIFLNVDSNVGRNLSAEPEDVLLVQFMLRKVGEVGSTAFSADQLALLRQVPLSGKVDNTTHDAIITWQTVGGDQVDGVISVARGYMWGPKRWTIAQMNATINNRFHDIYPNIDRIPGCPAPLAKAVRSALAGSGK